MPIHSPDHAAPDQRESVRAESSIDEPSRRQLLLGLALVAPVGAFVGAATLTGDAAGASFMLVSRIVIGTEGLSPAIGARIERLLDDRLPGFDGRLRSLAQALGSAIGDRNARLAVLTADQVATAIDIAKPWYLGQVGTPSDFVLHDDAAFVTYLEAQSFAKIVDVVPRPSYPGHEAGWWGGAPPGVTPPPMPAEILSWAFQAPGPGRPRTPDPRWRSYAAATFKTVDDARKAKP